MIKKVIGLVILMSLINCQENTSNRKEENKVAEKIFVWEAANIYFLLTDRFNNGDSSNDINFERTKETGVLRGFEGGDIKGITQKIQEGYFTKLGINAIWMTPVVEQIHDGTNEGTGVTYPYHGYWTKDWTSIDPNFGTKEDLKELVAAAHKNGIRVLLDAVINHTGPVTDKDPVWPSDWVRTGPACNYKDYESTVMCTLVENLPDIKTESNEDVALPPQLVEKWKAEGRYEQEVKELDAFFEKTGHPRAPRFYIMKWLTDYITEFGIDGYRVDTVKHTEESIWQEFKVECDVAFAEYKNNNPDKVLDDNDFYLVGEVYNYTISAGKAFDFGDKKVNYFDKAFNSLINFELKWNVAQMEREAVFSKYDSILNTNLKGYGITNYLSSHDDGQPFDASREKPYKTAEMLFLTPGTAQVYYGDESARSLIIEGAVGDATLRSSMNWEAINNDFKTQDILHHWQKLGKFRAQHPAVGAGKHNMISQNPYLFSRKFTKGDFTDKVVIGLDLSEGKKELNVGGIFEDDIELKDAYSGESAKVKNGKITINSKFGIVLLEEIR